MEPTDLPLVVPVRKTNFALFADDLAELDDLQKALAVENGTDKDKRPGTANTQASSAVDASLEKAAAAPPEKPAKKGPAGKKGAAAKQPTPEPVAPTPDDEAADAAAAVPPVEDPWALQIASLEKELEAHIADTADFRDFEAKRLEFFAQRRAEEYMIEDVLCDWEAPPERVPAMCVDVVAMSRAHAEAMSERYGYRPPRGLHVAGHVRPEDVPDNAKQPDMLKTHTAAGAEMDKQFVCERTLKGTHTAATQRTQRSQMRSQGGMSVRTADSFGLVDGDFDSPTKEKHVPRAPPPGTKKATTHSPQAQRLASVRGAGVPAMAVEVSRQSFDFQQCNPGTQYELRCRVWNRDTTSRRFKLKIDGDVRKLLKLDVLTPGFNTEVPVVPGNSFEFAVTFSPVDTEPLRCSVQLGHARDINRVDQASNSHSQWNFLPLPVEGTCLAPSLDFGDLIPEFEPCFVGSTRTIRALARNTGCAGTVRLEPTAPWLTCSVPGSSDIAGPQLLTLGSGEAAEVAFTFAPDDVGALAAEVVMSGFLPSQDPSDEAAAPVSTRSLRFAGEGVAPIVRLVQFADADLSSLTLSEEESASAPRSPTSAVAQLPLVTVEEAHVGHNATRSAVVENTCSLPVTVTWSIQTLGNCRVAVSPHEVTLAPRETRTFTMSLLPLQLRSSGDGDGAINDDPTSTESVVSLLLVDVPRPAAAFAARLSHRSFVKPVFPSTVRLTQRSNDLDPFALFSPRMVEKPGKVGADTGAASQAQYADPNTTHTRQHNEALDAPESARRAEHFCAAVRVVADPVPPNCDVAPSVLVAEAPCLIHQPNTREVVLTNTSPHELQLWLDPPAGADHPAHELARLLPRDADVTQLSAEFARMCRGRCLPNQRHDVDIVITPQRLTIPGGKSKTVTVKYTAKRAGSISATMECFSPVLPRPPVITLSLTSRGPEVALSASIIEYGVIPVGGEAEGRVTLTNYNPIPVIFSLLDTRESSKVTTLSLEPGGAAGDNAGVPSDEDRLVFLPAAGSLAPRESRDITVYLRGLEPGAVEDRIRVAVEDGVSSYVTVKASVQQPRACVAPATVAIPNVQRNVPAECVAYVTNLSAVDMEYEIVPVNVPRGVSVQPTDGAAAMLHAGAADVPVRFSVVFSGLRPQVALMALKSDALPDLVPFEITCDAVEQLRVSVGVTTPETPSSTITVDAFCEGLVEDIAMAAFMRSEQLTFLEDVDGDGVVDAPTTSAADASEARGLGRAGKSKSDKLSMRCPCPAITACGTIDGTMPYAVATAKITLTNLSGCFTHLAAKVGHYAPPTAEDLAARGFTPSPPTPPPEAGGGEKRTMSMGRLAPLDATTTTATGKRNAPGAAPSLAMNSTMSTVGTTSKRSAGKAALALASGSAGKTFTCKATNGLEEQEAAERASLGSVQSALVHGAGFAIELSDSSHALTPHETFEIDVRLIANVPGHYEDRIIIDIDHMPKTSIPVTFHVEGKAIVMDPFTSGLTVGQGGIARLQMPPIVPGLAAVKRTLTVTSRCPRELVLSARLVEWGQTLSLAGSTFQEGGASDESPNAGVVSLQLASMLDPESEVPLSAATVSPSSLTIPALQTTQVVLQYTPPANPLKDFHASLYITTVPAPTPANDRFLVDEFYLRNASRFAQAAGDLKRVLTQQAVILKDGINVRGVPKIMVRPPLVDRSGVVAGGVIVPLDDSMKLAMEVPTPKAGSAQQSSSGAAGADDDDSDDETTTARATKADQALQQRMREAKARNRAVLAERDELQAFIARRRSEICDEWARHVRPIEVEIHVAHLAPKLTTDPPSTLRLPMCHRTAANSRTINLTNEGAAPVDFRLVVGAGPFRITKTLLRAENKGKAVDFAASKLAASFRIGRPQSRESEAANQLFRLRPSDVLVVTVELTDLGGTHGKHQIEGRMDVAFADGNHVQPVPILATVHVPVVEVEHESVTFRPTVAVTGGRKQPMHKRTVRLINPSSCEASFVIRHDPADRPLTTRVEAPPRAAVAKAANAAIDGVSAAGSSGFDKPGLNASRKTTALGATGGAAEANNVTVQLADDDALPVDDPRRFDIEVIRGTIPAATLGSKPSVLDVPVQFVEYGMTHFQSSFFVEVEGGVGCRFTLHGESRSTELE